MLLFDYIFNLGCDFFKDQVKNKSEKKKLYEALEAYFSKKNIENYDCSLDDEIDFNGLIQYISHELHDKLEQRLFGRTSKERGQAHQDIINQAIAYSHAQTGEAQKKVIKILNDTLCILRGIHWSRVPQSTQLAATTIVDEIEEQHSEQTQALLSAIKEVKASQSLFSPKENLDLIKQGNIEQVDENLNSLFKVLSTGHKLSPYYGFAPQSDGFNLHSISVPLSEDAIKKYPPNIKYQGRISINGKYVSEPAQSVFNYSYRHQVPIIFHIDKAQKYLGTELDPQQIEAQRAIGTSVIINPQPFPNARPYSISVEGCVVLEYILLRIKEIKEDGTYVLSNEEQKDYPIGIILSMNAETKTVQCHCKTNSDKCVDRLKYVKLLKAISSGGKIHIRDLENGSMLLESQFRPKQASETVPFDEIEFLENLHYIEECFDKEIPLPDTLYHEDFVNVLHLGAIISGKELTGMWTQFDFFLPIDKKMRSAILKNNDPRDISYVGSATFRIFDEEYTIPLLRVMYSAVFKDYSKVVKKLEVLDDGDEIKLIYVPANNEPQSKYIERIGIEEFEKPQEEI